MSEIATTLVETRTCKECGEKKPITDFYRDGRWYHRSCKFCVLKKQTEYHHRHWKEFYQKHREVRKQRTRTFYHSILKPRNLALYGKATSPEETAQRKQVRENRKRLTGYTKTEAQRVRSREHFLLLRTRAIALYGGKCECCGEARYKMLTIDHKTGHKDKIHGVALVYEALREYERSGYPNDRYRLLCWNCNTSRGFYGYCPHTGQTRGECSSGSNKRWQLKLEMIAAYGGRCMLCGETTTEFLTIDHVNGGGDKHRKEVGTGNRFRVWLKKQGWPKDEYRLLCASCNCSDKRNGWGQPKTLKED